MIVRAAGDDTETALRDGRRHGFGVGNHLLLVVLERLLRGFLETNGFGGDGVNQRPALRAGESELVEFLGDRKSTRLNSSHGSISYAVFCLQKKKDIQQ